MPILEPSNSITPGSEQPKKSQRLWANQSFSFSSHSFYFLGGFRDFLVWIVAFFVGVVSGFFVLLRVF